MNKTRVAASLLGIIAGLGGGVFHGIGAVLQGNVATNEIVIEAWPAMQATLGEPAMTLVPNFLLTGILAIIMGIIVTIWAAAYWKEKWRFDPDCAFSNNALCWWRYYPALIWSTSRGHWLKN